MAVLERDRIKRYFFKYPLNLLSTSDFLHMNWMFVILQVAKWKCLLMFGSSMYRGSVIYFFTFHVGRVFYWLVPECNTFVLHAFEDYRKKVRLKGSI